MDKRKSLLFVGLKGKEARENEMISKRGNDEGMMEEKRKVM